MKKITLQTPVTLGERTITELNMRTAKVRDFVCTDGLNIDSVSSDLALCSQLTGESVDLLGLMEIEDWAIVRVELAKIWKSFFGIKEVDKNPPKEAAETETEPEPAA